MRFQVEPGAGGLPLGKYLFDRLKLSRAFVRRAKNEGGIFVDGRPATTRFLLSGGEEVELRTEVASGVIPEAMDLSVVYEDADVLVVDKPAGMVVHPVRNYTTQTLANGVVYHLMERGEEPVARPVLRIDRETSGLVLFGKNQVAAQRLALALQRHKLERRYVAFMHGRLQPDRGTVDVPVRRVWGHSVAREAAVGPRAPEQEAQLTAAESAGRVLRADWTAGGQRAVTHWEVLRRGAEVSLAALWLETGRTHQIRVHMAYLGHPLLGDGLYGCGGPPGRQALHAASLAFAHPSGGAVLRLEAPLPPDLAALMEGLENKAIPGSGGS